MAKIEGEITIKVSNAKELQELNSNIKKAIQLSKELNDVLKDIKKKKVSCYNWVLINFGFNPIINIKRKR